MVRERMTIPFSEFDSLPDGPGVYIVWSVLGGMMKMAMVESSERPLYIGKTKRDVWKRISEHVERGSDAVPSLESLASIEYIPCQNDRHARALERELQEKLNPYYGWG